MTIPLKKLDGLNRGAPRSPPLLPHTDRPRRALAVGGVSDRGDNSACRDNTRAFKHSLLPCWRRSWRRQCSRRSVVGSPGGSADPIWTGSACGGSGRGAGCATRKLCIYDLSSPGAGKLMLVRSSVGVQSLSPDPYAPRARTACAPIDGFRAPCRCLPPWPSQSLPLDARA